MCELAPRADQLREWMVGAVEECGTVDSVRRDLRSTRDLVRLMFTWRPVGVVVETGVDLDSRTPQAPPPFPPGQSLSVG